jgi:hypothetical protein
MKYKNQMLFMLSVAALFVWTACSDGGSGSEEPNNTIEEAKEMELDKVQTFKIQPEGDHDWFKVNVPEEGYLKVAASDVPSDLDLVFRVALQQEWEGTSKRFLSEYRSVPGAVMLLEGNEYYVLVHQNYDEGTSDQEIKLKITHLPQFDKTEYNDTPEEAAEAKLGETFPIAIFPLGDVEFYKFTVEEEGYIRLMAKDVPEAITPVYRVSLYDEWSDPKLKELTDWTEFPGAFYVEEPGDYYVKITDDYDDAASEKLFDIRSEFLAQNDTLEPNEKHISAYTASRGDTLRMAIFPVGDADMYKVASEEGTTLKVSAKDVKDITLVARLFIIDPEDSNKLKSVSDWEEVPYEFEVEPNMDYYIKFADDYDDAAFYDLFEVRIE